MPIKCDLKSFKVDLQNFEKIVVEVPDSVKILVAESGIHSTKDAVRMIRSGANALLIGTHFMRQSFPGIALEQMIAEYAEWSR